MILLFVLFRARMLKLDDEADFEHVSQGDYTARLYNIPKVFEVNNKRH